jgi:hypothetical protein
MLRSSVLRMVCGPGVPRGVVSKLSKPVKWRKWPIRATSLHRVAGDAVIAVCSARCRSRASRQAGPGASGLWQVSPFGVNSLARPNGNTTRVSILATELDDKLQDILMKQGQG